MSFLINVSNVGINNKIKLTNICDNVRRNETDGRCLLSRAKCDAKEKTKISPKHFFLDFKTTINLKLEFRSCKKRFTTNSMFNYATLGAALNTITASISFLLFVFVCLSISLTLSLPVHLLLCMCLYFCVTFSRHPFLFIILNVYLQRE